ncbi:MAG: MerR family transcriptional regulator [Eubacterium sp.]|jgi:DNA-binding transcriptional MerR regulator|nr:MerR family transcriptional regulator [Eubacterium sp.]
MKEPVQLCYTISEAAKLMNVEPHVLRYWEDELNLNIARNSMGHRIYTDDDLKIFKSIQNLKASHISLKDIRDQLPSSASAPSAATYYQTGSSSVKSSDSSGNADKMTQFKSILTNIIKDAMSENSKEMSDDISSRVSDNVRKEIDFLIRQRDEEEEARFKQLDETIRTFQKARQEAASAKISEKKEKKRNLFSKRKQKAK